MGTGTGYGRFPRNVHDKSWRIFAVRGPLTAQAIGNSELAVTDPAVLLSLLPEFQASRRSGAAFVPHWTTAASGQWEEICELIGIEFIDPRDEARSVIRRIASSAIVIAESMHGAIVADAFRVPWVPVVISHSRPLKWHDWTLSLGLQYHPIRITNLNSSRRAIFDVLCQRLTSTPLVDDYDKHVQAELTAFLTRSSVTPSVETRGSQSAFKKGVWRTLDSATRPLKVTHAVRTLQAVLDMPTMLSSEDIMASKREILLQRIEALREDYATGRLG
jgi:hypothetical protein